MGAITIAGRWRTTATPEELWTVVVDLRTWPEWWPAISRVERLGGAADAPDAARLIFDTPPPLRPLAVGLEVLEREPPHRLIVQITDGPLSGRGTLIVTDHPEGSTVDYDVLLKVRSLLFRPLEAILAGATRSGGSSRLARAGEDLARLAGAELLAHEV